MSRRSPFSDRSEEDEYSSESESLSSPVSRGSPRNYRRQTTTTNIREDRGVVIPRLVRPIVSERRIARETPSVQSASESSSSASNPASSVNLSPIIPEVLSPVPSPIATMETTFCGLNSVGQGNFVNSLRVADAASGYQSQFLVYSSSIYNVVIPLSIRATGILGLAPSNTYLASVCGVYGGRIPGSVVPLSSYRKNAKLEDPCLLLYSISSGLESLHNLNIIHGSLSDQIIGVEAGSVSRMQIVDFTSATSLLGNHSSIPSNLITYDTNDTSFIISSNSNYLAPEWPSVGAYTDVWALGVLALQMFNISPNIPEDTYTSQRAKDLLRKFYTSPQLWYGKILDYFVDHYKLKMKANVDLAISNIMSNQPIDLTGITSDSNLEELETILQTEERNVTNIRRRIDTELDAYSRSLYSQVSDSVAKLLSQMLSYDHLSRIPISYVRKSSFDIITTLGINIEPIEPTVIQTASVTGPIYNSWYYSYMYQTITSLAREFQLNWVTLFATYHYSYHMLASLNLHTYPDGNIVPEEDISQYPDIFEKVRGEITEMVFNAIHAAIFMYDRVSAAKYAYDADRIDKVVTLLEGKLITTRIFPTARSARVLAEVWSSFANPNLYYGVDWGNVLSTNEIMEAESKTSLAII
jgi:hypothetical protein